MNRRIKKDQAKAMGLFAGNAMWKNRMAF